MPYDYVPLPDGTFDVWDIETGHKVANTLNEGLAQVLCGMDMHDLREAGERFDSREARAALAKAQGPEGGSK